VHTLNLISMLLLATQIKEDLCFVLLTVVVVEYTLLLLTVVDIPLLPVHMDIVEAEVG